MHNIENILNKEMDRKEFLMFCGVFLLTISGILSIVSSILNFDPHNPLKKPEESFGSGPYGGRKEIF